MEFKFKKKIGETEVEFVESADSHAEFVKKMTFFSSLPTVGPNGETDLQLRARQTSAGYYYSVVSPSAKKELTLGQYKEPRLGELYVKGWEDLYEHDNASNDAAPAPYAQNPATTVAPAAETPAPAQTAAPAATPAFAAAPKTETPAPAPAAPETTKVETPAPAQAAPVNDVLAKYGIKK